MQGEVLYDALIASRAPVSALYFAAAAAFLAAGWGLWLHRRNESIHAGVKALAGIALFLAALSALYRYELWLLASRAQILEVEGPVQGYWTRRVDRETGQRRLYWDWEGFSVGGVEFAYPRNAEQNYFHNAAPGAIPITGGMRLRIRYIQEQDGRDVRNRIVRLEGPGGALQPLEGSSRK